jgi:hypothetical protein
MSGVNEWCLPSNGGWSSVRFEALALHASIKAIEYRIELTGQSWYRPGLLVEPHEYQKSDDFRLNLLSVLIPVEECLRLVDDFDNWLNSLAPFTRTLCSTLGQVLTIDVGDREGFAARGDHPVLTFFYAAGPCRLELFFAVDQSCIRIARGQLYAVLSSFTLTGSS